jgi:tripartite ATP-independent transporter DctP family solute receptor
MRSGAVTGLGRVMRAARRATLAVAAALLLAGCAEREPEIVLRAADDHELSYPTSQGLVRMGKLIEEWSDGRIRVRVYPQAQLGSERETIQKTTEGLIDINRVNINPVTTLEPALKALALPYIFRSAEHMHKVVDGEIGRELLGKLEDSGLVGLGYYDSGQRSFYSSAGPIRGIEDLDGLRIRVQKAPIMEDMVRAVGAVPVQMAFEEVYTGLQTGVIQGAENNFPSWVTKGHYEVARYYTLDAHVRAPEVILFSKKRWDALSAADQKLIRRAARESVPYQRALWKEKVEDSIAKAREAECEIITEIDREPFVEAMERVYETHAADLMHYVERIRAVE